MFHGSYFIKPFGFVWIGDSDFSFYRMTKGEFEYRVYSFGNREMYIDSVFAARHEGIRLIEENRYDSLIIEQVLEYANDDMVFGYYTYDEPGRDHFEAMAYINNLMQDTLEKNGINLLPIQNRRIFPSENYTPLWPEKPETSNRGGYGTPFHTIIYKSGVSR